MSLKGINKTNLFNKGYNLCHKTKAKEKKKEPC